MSALKPKATMEARMARDVLVASGRDPTRSGQLAGLVRDIIRSDFWMRAMAARRRVFEMPFAVRVGPADPGYADLIGRIGLAPSAGGRPLAPVPGAPVVLSGAVDLLFEEEGGWVIVDYKTDRIPEEILERGAEETRVAFNALVEHYRPQVELYTRFWERMTGAKVKESGIYFTSIGRWVELS
jgi:ATP-dependent helicase/nuclease subunit A